MDAYSRFAKALQALQTGMICHPDPAGDPIVVYGLAHAFNVCFEQAWRFLKAWGEREGRKEAASGSPRTILKLAYQLGWISNENIWIEMLHARQLSVHAYGDELGVRLLNHLPAFAAQLTALQRRAQQVFGR